jgi:glutathione S-transferase
VPQRPEVTAYVERLTARPALQRAQAKDEELAGRKGGG